MSTVDRHSHTHTFDINAFFFLQFTAFSPQSSGGLEADKFLVV